MYGMPASRSVSSDNGRSPVAVSVASSRRSSLRPRYSPGKLTLPTNSQRSSPNRSVIAAGAP